MSGARFISDDLVWQEVHHHIVDIAYYPELNLQICDFPQIDAVVTKIANTCLTKVLWPFLPSPKGSQLLPPCFNHYHSQENGRPRKEDQKRKRPGRERKWVRRYLDHSVIIIVDAERLTETFVEDNFTTYVGRGGPLLSLFF